MILAIDQSTSGTKALLFDAQGRLIYREDRAHRQIVDENGWVEHDPEEISANILALLAVINEKYDFADIRAIGISNQRETVMAWDRVTGKPLHNAIVWQCARGEGICREIEARGQAERVREITGLPLSPYFSAAKLAWLHRHVPEVCVAARAGRLCCGTMDAWVLQTLTGGKSWKTEYSNASRTQLFSLRELRWSEEVCSIFGISPDWLPEVCDSDAEFGKLTLSGFPEVPIRAMMGDSHAALFGHGCLSPGMVKATYGTGSSVMMNTGAELVVSGSGLVSSLAWGRGDKVDYVLEGNINYSGAVIGWLVDALGLAGSAKEIEKLAESADPEDGSYIVPAFSGLGAPYWNAGARAAILGMGRSTGKAEIAKAALESIAYQTTAVALAIAEDMPVAALHADGGPTRNAGLMQLQSDLLEKEVRVSATEEISGAGVAYMAGIAAGAYDSATIFDQRQYTVYAPEMDEKTRKKKRAGWRDAVRRVL